MTPAHYYNEHNAYRAAVLRERMEDGLLPQGVVDERDIEIVPDDDFQGYTQIHLFAGIGGFPLGLRRAGFPEDVRIVTGGFPCQDISNAGKRAGITGSRSRLWREMVRCIRVVRPELVFVENVAALLCRGMGEVLGDLAEIGYDAEGDCLSAADVGAPHLRRRIWILAYAIGDGVRNESIAERWRGGAAIIEHAGEVSDAASLRGPSLFGDESHGDVSRILADATERGQPVRGEPSGSNRFAARGGEAVADAERSERWTDSEGRNVSNGHDAGREKETSGTRERGETLADTAGARCDGEVPNNDTARQPFFQGECSSAEPSGRFESHAENRWPVEPDVGRVAHGIPKRVDRLAALGDAIVPACVEEVIKRFF